MAAGGSRAVLRLPRWAAGRVWDGWMRMSWLNSGWALLALTVAGASPPRAHAECAPFYESFNSLASITANGGATGGSLTFVPGINGNAADWGTSGHVTYSGRNFRTPSGSLSLWYKKTSAAASGGICQIGTVSQANSIGLFYNNSDDLCFEMRTSTGLMGQIALTDALPANVWTHVAAAWREQNGACDLWLSVNGDYRDHAQLSGTLSHATATLQVGSTGYYNYGGGDTDELRWFDWDLIDSEVYAEYVYSSNRFLRQPTTKPVSTGPVQVSGSCLYVSGMPFKVKGVGYAPTPIGSWSGSSDPAILARDVPLLWAMNVNTIRTWSQPPDSTLLNAMYYNGGQPIYTIVGFWIPTNVDFGDPAVITQYSNAFRNLVNQFKNHPGLLAWGIGNEVNLNASGSALTEWYTLANFLAHVAYTAEGPTYHPTIVVNGGLLGLGNVDHASDDASLNWVDIWGQNTYFGWDAHCFFDYYQRLSAKPLLFTEYGIDAWNNVAGAEYQDVQAAWEVRQWRQIRRATLGATVMAYSDEWWKAGDPNSHDFGGYPTKTHPDGYSNEEWWGVVAVQDNGGGPDIVHPRQAYYALGQEFAYSAGDYDRDGDVDLTDFAAFQTCFGGGTSGLCGTVFDYVVDDAIDAGDFTALLDGLNGPGQLPACCP
jgi:hypothetical protein